LEKERAVLEESREGLIHMLKTKYPSALKLILLYI
jgi:hypothetical protein